MDKITIERISQAHPKLRVSLLQQYKEINNKLPKGVRLRFSYVFRTAKEQHELFLQRPKVTNADSWQSIHNFGLAFDIVMLYDKDNNGTFETASWEKDKYWIQVTEYFKSKGWVCGADWKTFKDAPHFEYTFGFDWRVLKARYDKGITIVDNGIIYVKI